jgi:hypothetical protein
MDGFQIAALCAADSSPQERNEVLDALAVLLKHSGAQNLVDKNASLSSPDGLKAIAALISAVAWPAVIVGGLLLYRSQITNLLQRITKWKFPLIGEIEIGHELEEAAEEAKSAPLLAGKGPTTSEIARAGHVEKLAHGAGASVIEQKVRSLAEEYEGIRASMSPGNDRTRQMEIVASKMRTIGRAANSLRYRLSASASPGERLQAISILQIEPDYEFIEWLAERVALEKPFLQFHALAALNILANGARAKDYYAKFTDIMPRLDQAAPGFGRDSSRIDMLTRLKEQIARLGSGK